MTKKTIYDIASENDFKVFVAYVKPQKHGGEYSYLRIYSQTWPYIVLTYKRTTAIKERRYSLFESKPEVFSESIDPTNIPVERIAQAAKSFADAANIMKVLKELNPDLPSWREHEEPEWGDR